jgi:cobalt-precorrin 5A hydrolase/precorrin-3B C17-methyltransferase
MSILSISITEAGRRHAAHLPYATEHGDLAPTVRERWNDVDAFVLFCSVGIAVRVVGPLLDDKSTDPIVVVVDDSGAHVVALVGGHRGANDLAVDVATLLGAVPVVSTATDVTATPALDTLAGFVAVGNIAEITRKLLDGNPVRLGSSVDLAHWPIPDSLAHLVDVPAGDGTEIIVSDRRSARMVGVALHPPTLVVGIGSSTDAAESAASELLDAALNEHDLARESIALVATIDRRATHPVVTSLGLPIRSFTSTDLAAVEVPNPSDVVAAEVGTPSVAEAAALLAAGPGGQLVVTKRKGATATVAIARRATPEGSLQVVGLGPGDAKHRTPEAVTAIRHADVVIGYEYYVDQCTDLCRASQEIVRSPIGAEIDRCVEAVERAAKGQRVALVCSGDPGIFAMATLVLDVAARYGHPPIHIVPGVTASLAAASILGAPLAHDHALVSLSDLLTPWAVIEQRLHALAAGDLAVAFYNPRSQRRVTQLEAARDILLTARGVTTPVGIVVNATREGERVIATTLGEMDTADVDMFSIVVVGSSTTEWSNGRMVTPRGYDSALA